MKANRIVKALSYIVILSAVLLLVLVVFGLKSSHKTFNLYGNKSYEQAVAAIKSQEIKYDTATLNELLKEVDTTKFTEIEKTKIKREIIRKAGFVNFDWKETLADVTSFQDVKIEIDELKAPLVLYRRGYPNEPTSKFGLGRWWSDKPRSIGVARDELAILENWGNPLSAEYKIRVPAGTRILKGIAAPQEFRNPSGQVLETRKGGGVQYFVDTLSNDWLQK